MFIKIGRLQEVLEEVVERIVAKPTARHYVELQQKVVDLTETRRVLKEEIEDLKLKKKIEQEEIDHLLKIHTEKQAIERQKWELTKEKEYQDREINRQSVLHDTIVKAQTELHEKSMDLIGGLPNVTANFKKVDVSVSKPTVDGLRKEVSEWLKRES